MGDNSKIQWTEASWNPIRAVTLNGERIGWHCEHASPGCVNCYAETLNMTGRSVHSGTKLPFKPGHRKDVSIYVDQKMLLKPLSWQRPRRIFVCSMTDLFGEFVTEEMIDQVFAVMALATRHTFQVLTKRSDRMFRYLNDPETRYRIADAYRAIQKERGVTVYAVYTTDGELDDPEYEFRPIWPLPHVWLGVSVEDQQRANERIPALKETPAAVRWLSCEPLLENLDLSDLIFMEAECPNWEMEGSTPPMDPETGAQECCTDCDFTGVVSVSAIGWIVAGGESGKNARGSKAEVEANMRSLRDQCGAADVAFFGKQNFKKQPLPDDLMVREYPE